MLHVTHWAHELQEAEKVATPAVWFDVVGGDGAKLRRFYRELFDWQIDDSDTTMDYGLVAPAEGGIGGGRSESVWRGRPRHLLRRGERS